MNIRKHFKKFIVVLVLLILFNFCIPKIVHAGLVEDITAAPAKIFWLMEEGILFWLNNTFTSDDYKAKSTREIDSDGNVTIDLNIYLTPETIIKGNFLIFDANIFRNIDKIEDTSEIYDYDGEKNSDGTYKNAVMAGKVKLRETISGWYFAIRNFAIVALLSVLVYVGIRMIISTLAQDKAKYKTMFKDWLVAICLVVVMHYFMISILNISTKITEALGGGKNSDMISRLATDINNILTGENYQAKNAETGENMDLGDAYAKILVLGGVIVYTIIFAIKYLKREFTIMFLTIVGPAACITYPIDKIGDGKAQAYNRWFTEYLYQVIIQPFHLLLYIVLIGTAAELANSNVLYALVCFAVMGPAEKFIKEMFGFKDKLGSPLGTMMKAGLAKDMMNRATSALMGGKGGKTNSGGGNSRNENDSNNLPLRTPTRGTDYAMLGGNTEEGQSANSSQQLNTDNSNNSDEIDYERAEAFRNAREEGLSQEEALDRVNQELPIDRNEDITETLSDTAEMAAIDEAEDGHERINGETEADRAQENNEQHRRIRDMLRHPIQTFDNSDFGKKHNQRVSAKYGTTSRGKRWLKRAPKIVKGVFKGTGQLAKAVAFTTTAIGAAGYAAVTGNGAEAAGILAGAAGIAATRGARAIKGVAKDGARFTKSAAKDYYRSGAIPFQHKAENNIIASDLRLDSGSRDFARFEADPEEQRRAADTFRLNNGHEANREELRQELRDRFALSQIRGMNSDLIDKSIGRYQELKSIPGMSDSKAANQAAIEAQLGDAYKGKFGKQKDVEDMIKAQTKLFESEGYGHQAAEQSAINLIAGAAKMNKESLVLPEGKQVVEVPIRPPNIATNLGIQERPEFTEDKVQIMNDLTIKLMEMDYTSAEIQRIAGSVAANPGENVTTVLDRYNARVEFIGNQQNAARRRAARARNVDTNQVSTQEVKMEVDRGIELVDKHNVSPDKIDGARSIEQKLEKKPELNIGAGRNRRTVSQKELTWEKAVEIKGKSKQEINLIEKRLARQMREGGSTAETAKKDAKNIITDARRLEAKTE